MNSLIKRTCEGAYFTHSCNRRVTAASQQPLFRPAISSVTGEVDVASCAALLCMCTMLIGSRVGKAEPGNPRPAQRKRNFDLWWWVTQTCLCMRSQSSDCVCGSGLGDSHIQTEGLKNSQMLLMRSKTHKLFVCKTIFMSIYAQMMNPPTL